MKKFSNFEEEEKTTHNNFKSFVNQILKENISIEVMGDDKPWNKDIEVKTDISEDFIKKIEDYIIEEINKSELNLLESIKLSYYNNSLLSFIEEKTNELRNKEIKK